MGSPRAPSVRLLFHDTRATPTLLEFLEDTRVGRVPGQVLLAGGPVVGGDDLHEIVLGLRRRRSPTAAGLVKEEDWSGPPILNVSFLCVFLFFLLF